MFNKMYLDCNAHVPLHPKALQAYVDYNKSEASHGHPLAPTEPGRLAATALEEARNKIASLIGAKKASQIIFTSSCTQACEWGIQILAAEDGDRPPAESWSEESWSPLMCSPVEHSSVRDVYEDVYRQTYHGSPEYIKVDSDGVIQETDTDKAICIHVQNEIGLIQPLNRIKRKLLFSDMSQSLGKIDLNVTELNVDIASFGSHKFGGPTGFGFMYLKDSSLWESFGAGNRYFLDRAGTPDVAGAVASAVALEEAISSMPARNKNMLGFQSVLEDGLEKMGFEIVGKKAARCFNTSFVNIPGRALEAISGLSKKGIYIGLGSACGSSHAGQNPVIKNIGRSGSAQDYVRISQFGEYGEKHAKYFLETFTKLFTRGTV